jgi:hypothetical protein
MVIPCALMSIMAWKCALSYEVLKVKLTLKQAVKAQRGSRGIAVIFL